MTYKVLVTKQTDSRYMARAFVLPDIVAYGDTESEAVDQLRVALTNVQAHSRIVQVDLPLSDEPVENPWLRHAGIWEHDSDWDAFQTAVKAYRLGVDNQLESA